MLRSITLKCRKRKEILFLFCNANFTTNLEKNFVLYSTEDIESLGCWRDISTKRALPSLEKTHHILSDPYKKRSNPILKCAQVANDRGFTIFGIQHGGQCFAGHNGDKTFSMYGPSNLCKGKPYKSLIYVSKLTKVWWW